MTLSERKFQIVAEVERMLALHDFGSVIVKFEDPNGECGTLEMGFGRPPVVVMHDPHGPVPIPAPKNDHA